MTTQQKPLYGILLILCAGSLLATHDGVSKHLTHLYPLVMVIWARYAVQSVVMFLLFFPKMRWARAYSTPSATTIARTKLVEHQRAIYWWLALYPPR